MKMREVKVKRLELLLAVRENRGKHISEYEEAVEGYKQAALDAVDKAMVKLRRRVEELEAGEVLVLDVVTFNLLVPRNHKQDYDQAIRMLEMSVDEELTIRADEFACYVMDDWDWKADFLNVSNTYKQRR
jgi:hypothetical protein